MTAISRWRSANQAARDGRPLRGRYWPPPIHQDAASFSLSGHLFWTLEREETEALRVCSPVAQHLIIADRFYILPVCQLSMTFLTHRCLCWERLKRFRRRGDVFYFQEHGPAPHAFSPSQTSRWCSCKKKPWTSACSLECSCLKLWDVRSSLSSVSFIKPPGALSHEDVRHGWVSVCVWMYSLCKRLERNSAVNKTIQKEEEEYKDSIEIQEIQPMVQH